MDWRSFTLYVAKALAALLAIVTHGLIAQFLGLAMYGQFSLFIGLSFLATQLGDAGATMVGAKEVSQDPQQAGQIQRLRLIGYGIATLAYLAAASLYDIDGLWVGALAVIAFFGITDWSLRGQGMPHKASIRQVAQGLLQVLLLTVLISNSSISSSINPLSLAIAGFAGGTLLSTLLTWKSSYAPLRHLTRDSLKQCKKTYRRLKSAHAGVLVLHAQYQLPLLALPVLANAEEAGRYGAAYVIFAGLSAAIVITQDIFLPKSSNEQASKQGQPARKNKRHYIAWQIASIALPVGVLLLLPVISPLLFGEEFVMDRGLAWGFVALTLAYGLRFLTIQMRLFKRQYTGFARLNGLSLLLQVVAWSAFLLMDSSITATMAVMTLAAAEVLTCLVAFMTQQPGTRLHVAMVTHQGGGVLWQRFKAFAYAIQASSKVAFDTSDHPAPWATPHVNDHFEFGAYLSAARHLMQQSHKAEQNDPCLLINDRMFSKRSTRGWAWLLRNRDKVHGSAIFGDIHREIKLAKALSLPDLAKPYVSSWLFYFPDERTLQCFIEALEQAIREDLARQDQSLNRDQAKLPVDRFIDHWLTATKGSRHQGPRDEESLARKARTIYMEHAISRHLTAKGVALKTYPGYAGVMRWMDRLCNRWC